MTTGSFTRRRFLSASSMMACGIALAPRKMFAQAAAPDMITQARAAAASAKITTQALRGNVTAVMGSGGNIALLAGKDGKVLIDSGYATSQPQITAALNQLSADPMTHLINTHWHFDHTDGNEWMHGAGATILAHENTKKRLSEPVTIADFHYTFQPAPAGARPTETMSQEKTLKLNGATLHLVHYAPAHTDTDISIHFQEADVLHCGDTFFNGRYPFIDYSTGGSINGMIAATDHNLILAGAKTIVIPGHGPVGDRAALQQFRDMLAFSRDAVGSLKKQGKTLDEVKAAKPLANYDTKWGNSAAMYLGLVYQGV